MLKDFLGNKETIIVLSDWLSTYYHHPTKEVPNYAILFGSTGNGKTYLPTILAKEFDVDLGKKWETYDFVELIKKMTGVNVLKADIKDMEKKLKELKLGVVTELIENVSVNEDWFKQI